VGTRIRRFVSESFGVRGSKNLTSWMLAGGLAYYFIYLPEQRRAQEIQVRNLSSRQLQSWMLLLLLLLPATVLLIVAWCSWR
jgi:hypothetical protein